MRVQSFRQWGFEELEVGLNRSLWVLEELGGQEGLRVIHRSQELEGF